jgi:TetR/AcrR family transcriptional regulator, transcriptional repressor for nem operon
MPNGPGRPPIRRPGARQLKTGEGRRKSTVTRTKPAEQRRAELLTAARALFLAKGVAATSLDEITQRAGVSKGLFYLYFASKEDLVLALQEQFSGEVAARMAAAAAPPAQAGQADWAARLDACVRAGFECYRELHDLHEVLFHHAHPVRSDPPLATLVIKDLLAAGVAEGTLDLSDPESTAVLCYASMHAFDLRGHGGPDDARLIRAAQQLVRRAAGLP